jgi:hypothetical protein
MAKIRIKLMKTTIFQLFFNLVNQYFFDFTEK